MSSTYNANPNISRTPSPQPGPGVQPSISLPSDGDADSAATFANALEVPTDFIGHIQSAVRLDVPVVAASGSGFTAPTYVSFGGTVTPSGSVKISTGTRFVIQIQTGGAVGVATFKTSMDGGNIYGALQTTAASMTDATSGITLAFSGTLTTNGTAAFRSGYTPQAEWLDQLGNVRHLVDHNGYPMARNTILDESWIGTANVTGPQSPVTAFQRWTAAGHASSTFVTQAPTSAYSSPWMAISAPNSASAIASLATAIQLIHPDNANLSHVIEWEAALTSANSGGVVTFMGLTDTPANMTSTARGAMVQVSATNYLLTNRNSGSNAVDSGVAQTLASTPSARFRLELHGTTSPYGAVTRLFVNGGLVATNTNQFPTTNALYLGFEIQQGGSPTGVATLNLGNVRAVHNRFLSTDPL